MKRRISFMALLLLANLLMAIQVSAHTSGWHWNRYGSTVTINVYNTATYRTEASNAIKDWDTHTILALPEVTYHSDIHVFDGNYGATGWVALAEITSYTSPNHITHGHARLNYYYSLSSTAKQGLFCQKLGQLFGLTSSPDGCMGGSLYYTVQHNWDDIYNMYRYTHH